MFTKENAFKNNSIFNSDIQERTSVVKDINSILRLDLDTKSYTLNEHRYASTLQSSREMHFSNLKEYMGKQSSRYDLKDLYDIQLTDPGSIAYQTPEFTEWTEANTDFYNRQNIDTQRVWTQEPTKNEEEI